MTKIRLEFESIKIHRDKKRWNLYFVIIAKHPTEQANSVLTVIPNQGIKLKPAANNEYYFEQPEQHGATGLLVYENDMPENNSIQAQVYLRHSRKDTRTAGDILQEISKALQGGVLGTVTGILGTACPWIVLTPFALQTIGTVLRGIPDRDFGFINMSQVFDDDFPNQTEMDFSGKFSTGEASICWSWSTFQL